MADIPTKSGLTSLYNERVVNVERMERPMSSSGKGLPLVVPHQGVRVTTESGQQHLVHKGSGFGKSSETVVTGAANMSSNWQVKETRSVSGHTVGDFVKTGGTNYSLVGDNCIHGASRMTGLGNK
ncbi:hypothetical protein GBAR_LOCUS618 [Geodia barretti]|uniref:Uncharacterized protein n=1 Tax=Geodia barretti TaxID=519541 RepID=A0AA35W3N7_GEOBA|nr:hypothetical protein GBAR_LOCUS618 [Geodia barretti]